MPNSGLSLATACAAFLAFGCATDKGVEPNSAEIDFFMGPPQGGAAFTTVFEKDTLDWKMDKAYGCFGEIGIHWSRVLAKTAHDVPGGPASPKIYDYFAVNLLETREIHSLIVPSALYDHVHMILRKAESDTIKRIEAAPDLMNHSLFFAGTVTHAGTVHPFRAEFDSTYSENGLGDVLFELEIRARESYALTLHPKLSTWFQDVIWSDLSELPGDTLVLRLDGAGRAAAAKIQNRFTIDNAFDIAVKANE